MALAVLFWAIQAPLSGQLSVSAFRVLGQPDLRQNGLNRVEGGELFSPNAVAVDRRGGEQHLYVADTGNHRVLGWRDTGAFQMGAAADLVLGQPNLSSSVPLGIGAGGLNSPLGLAVHPMTGDVYVADSGNNRLLRFPSPFDNPTRVEPDTFYGQPDLSSRGPNTGGISERSLRAPVALAFDRQNNLWVADRDNHRVLRFPAGSLDSSEAVADLVLGQADFESAGRNGPMGRVGAAGLNSPSGLAFDSRGRIYVADFSNARILVFNTPQSTGQEAELVLGQPDFVSNRVPPTPTASSLGGPAGLAISAAGSLYVALPLEHRVLVFENVSQAPADAQATGVLGQFVFTTAIRNVNTHPRASAAGLFGPAAVTVDSDGNVYIVDNGNHRVISIPPESTEANRVWGQADLVSNGANRIEADSISGAYQMAVDYSQAPFPLYVSDTNNHRVLIWKDSRRFPDGAPADLVIGQRDLTTAVANGDTGVGQSPTATSLSRPRGLALNQAGDLFVVDSGNNRVLRFRRPVDQSGRITADLVIGQRDFLSSISAAVSASSLRSPSGVAVGPQGDLFVSDTGNNRVLHFPPELSNGAAAVRVFGQPDFSSGSFPAQVSAASLLLPEGLFVDDFGFLYVADTAANRVLIYPNAIEAATTGASAATVLGQPRFDSGEAIAGLSGLQGPRQVATDSEGQIYVADSGNNRIMVFPSVVSLPIFGAEASDLIGQPNADSTRANWNSSDGRATPQGLFAPVGVFVDRNDTLYVGDTGNNRVIHFLRPAAAVNAAHFLPLVPVAPGGLISLFGSGFAADSAQATTTPLPRTLAGSMVEVNDTLRAPLLFVSGRQVNLQLPSQSPAGSQRIAVRRADTEELLAGGFVAVADSSPGFFTAQQNGSGQVLALNEDNTRNGASNPAARGSVVQVFGTGQGPLSPGIADGEPASSSPLSRTVAVPTADGGTCLTKQPAVCVAVGSSFGEILFSGMAPGFVGLWQVNVRIPRDALTGDAVPLRAVVNGRISNLPTLAVR